MVAVLVDKFGITFSGIVRNVEQSTIVHSECLYVNRFEGKDARSVNRPFIDNSSAVRTSKTIVPGCDNASLIDLSLANPNFSARIMYSEVASSAFVLRDPDCVSITVVGFISL
jgi:hypothetical protein